MRRLSEAVRLAPLRRVRLHHSHAAEHLAEPAAQLSLPAADAFEGRREAAEGTADTGGVETQDGQHGQSELGVEPEEESRGQGGGKHGSHQLHQPVADEVTRLLRIEGDPGR